MRTTSDTSRHYARAFAVRVRMIAFHADLDQRVDWRLASRILFRRFELAFGFFLDAPTAERLAKVIVYEAEIAEIAGRLQTPPQGASETH